MGQEQPNSGRIAIDKIKECFERAIEINEVSMNMVSSGVTLEDFREASSKIFDNDRSTVLGKLLVGLATRMVSVSEITKDDDHRFARFIDHINKITADLGRWIK